MNDTDQLVTLGDILDFIKEFKIRISENGISDSEISELSRIVKYVNFHVLCTLDVLKSPSLKDRGDWTAVARGAARNLTLAYFFDFIGKDKEAKMHMKHFVGAMMGFSGAVQDITPD